MRSVKISISFDVDTDLDDEKLDYYIRYLLGDFGDLIAEEPIQRTSEFVIGYEE